MQLGLSEGEGHYGPQYWYIELHADTQIMKLSNHNA